MVSRPRTFSGSVSSLLYAVIGAACLAGLLIPAEAQGWVRVKQIDPRMSGNNLVSDWTIHENKTQDDIITELENQYGNLNVVGHQQHDGVNVSASSARYIWDIYPYPFSAGSEGGIRVKKLDTSVSAGTNYTTNWRELEGWSVDQFISTLRDDYGSSNVNVVDHQRHDGKNASADGTPYLWDIMPIPPSSSDNTDTPPPDADVSELTDPPGSGGNGMMTINYVGRYEGTMTINYASGNTSVMTVNYTSCGDGIVQPSHEECDGNNLNGATCSSRGYDSGTLQCTDACTFDTSSCQSTSTAPVSSVTISAEPDNVRSGETVELSWSVPSAEYCTLTTPDNQNHRDYGTVAIENTALMSDPLQNTTTFTLTCHNDVSQASDSVTVQLIPSFEETWVPHMRTILSGVWSVVGSEWR